MTAHKDEIYLIWDRKMGCVSKATTNESAAYEEVKRLNSIEKYDIYRVITMKDFASR